MEAVELPNTDGLWSGQVIYAQGKVPKLLDHLQEAWTSKDRDPLAMNFYAFGGAQHTFAFVAAHAHTTHDNPKTLPPSISSTQSI